MRYIVLYTRSIFRGKNLVFLICVTIMWHSLTSLDYCCSIFYFLFQLVNILLRTFTDPSIVHVYVVFHFCDSVWYFSVEMNLCMCFIVCWCLYCHLWSNYEEEKVNIPLIV
jgi:hypothetical protein